MSIDIKMYRKLVLSLHTYRPKKVEDVVFVGIGNGERDGVPQKLL